jgi:hypothetical protein
MFQLCMASPSYHLLEQNWPSKGIIKSLDSWNHKRGWDKLHLTNDFCLHVISTTWPFGRCYHEVLPGSLIFQFSMAWNIRKRSLITHVYSSYIQLTNCRSLWKAAAWPPTCKTIEYFRPPLWHSCSWPLTFDGDECRHVWVAVSGEVFYRDPCVSKSNLLHTSFP